VFLIFTVFIFFQTMKNKTCKKLIIDRSKATKVGTLKDISLFGNFTFPTEGQFANGLQLRSLAGVGMLSIRHRHKLKHCLDARFQWLEQLVH